MAFILRGKRKGERVEISQHANDWTSTQDGSVFNVTSLLYTEEEIRTYFKQYEGVIWQYQIIPDKDGDIKTGFFKIRRRPRPSKKAIERFPGLMDYVRNNPVFIENADHTFITREVLEAARELFDREVEETPAARRIRERYLLGNFENNESQDN